MHCGNTPKDQFISIPGCSDDLSAISALPDQWTPKHCGETLTNFLKERQQIYTKICENITEESIVINKDVDDKVEMIAELLLSHIRQNEEDIECVIKKSKPNEKPVSIVERNNALRQISKLYSNRIEDLVTFKKEALALEKHRVDGLRCIMKLYFQRLIAVGQKSPKDLLHEFDEKIYEINHQLLSNCRAYTELELLLRAQLSESEIRARSTLNQLCLNATKILRHRSAFPWARETSIGNNVIKETEGKSEITINFEDLKDCVSQLIDAHYKTMINIFTQYLKMLKNSYKDNLVQNDNSFQHEIFVEDKTMESAMYRINNICISFKNINLDVILQGDAFSLQNSLSSLRKCLQDIFLLLFDVHYSKDNHLTRFNLMQKLALAILEDLQTSHDATELANEVNYNLSLEYMRNASDVEKLQHQFDFINNFLDKGAEIIFQHREAELNKIMEFNNFSSIMNNLFLTECYYYLDKYPRFPKGSEHQFNAIDTESIDIQIISLHESLVQALSQSHIKENLLVDCRNNFLNNFGNNLPKMSEILNNQTQEFMNELVLKINMRYSLKLMSHSIRAERLKAARQVRLAELQLHDTRLTSHIDAVYNLIDKLTGEASEYLALDAPELYPFCTWVKNIQSNVNSLMNQEGIDPEFKRLKLFSYSQRLSRHRQLFEESLNSAIDEFKRVIEYKIQVARISNVGFISHLKLRSEGGRYAPSEALKTCAALVRAGDALETCAHRVMDVLHHRRHQLLSLADHQLSIQKIDDVHKLGAKGMLDKKKLPQKGKR